MVRLRRSDLYWWIGLCECVAVALAVFVSLGTPEVSLDFRVNAFVFGHTRDVSGFKENVVFCL